MSYSNISKSPAREAVPGNYLIRLGVSYPNIAKIKARCAG